MSAGGSWKDLFLAAEEGDFTKARYHLELGVDPNFQHPEYFTAPLFAAIKHGHLDMVKILIDEGKADPALVEELTDDSAVDVALACREFAILDYLNTQLPIRERWSPHYVLVTTTGTGHNLETGKEICRRFLGKGHRVLLVCNISSIYNNRDELESVIDSIQKELRSDTNNPHVNCIVGSLETVKGTRALAAKIRKRLPLLNTLIHNAVLWATRSDRNEDGLERSFMVNCMARKILTNELMPLLNQNDDSRILYFLPDNSAATLYTPDLNATPFGNDFHWYRTISRTTGCSSISFLSAVREASDTSVAVSLVQAGRISHALSTATSSTWLVYLMSWLFYLQGLVLWIDDNPVKLVTATEPFLLAESGEFESLNGKTFHAQSGLTTETIEVDTRSVLLSRATLEEWEKWMADFLSRSSKS